MFAFGTPASALAASGPVITGSVADQNPMTCGNACDLSGTTSVAVSGNYAYATAYYSGKLTAIDISDPTNPRIAGESQFSNNLVGGSTVNISGGYAYVASKNLNASTTSNDDGISGNSLTILDIHSNPAVPTIVGTIRDPTELFGAYGVAVSGNHVYVAAQGILNLQPATPDTSTGSFATFDVSNPANPVLLGHLDNNALTGPDTNALKHACSVYVLGNYAYVTAAYSNDLTIIDISNPASPQIKATFNDGAKDINFDVDVAVQSNLAYVVDQLNGTSGRLTVVDVSSAIPAIVGTVSGSALNGAYRIRLRGNFAYVSASNSATVTAVDISNPASPQIAGSVTDPTHLSHTTGLDVDPTGRYVIASSPHLTSEPNVAFPPFPGQAGGPTTTGTISVIALAPTALSPPTISGSAVPGGTLTASPGSWTGVPPPTFTYQWQHCHSGVVGCAVITGATGSSYVTVAADIGSTIEVVVTGTNGLGSASATSTPTAVIQASSSSGSPPKNTSAPKISGTATQGATLTASTGSWTGSPAPAFTYRWERCNSHGAKCATITRAIRSKYALTARDVGARIRISVVAANSAGGAAAVSNAVGPVAASVVVKEASMAGIAKRRARLTFTVNSGRSAPALKTIAVGLPRGLAFAKSTGRLSKGTAVTNSRGQRERFTVKPSHGSLTITLRTAARRARLTIAGRAISVSPSLAVKIKDRKLRALDVLVKTTDSSHKTAHLLLALKPT